MVPVTLTESFIREHASAESIRRGKEYLRRGAVRSLRLRGDRIEASVEGSEYEPYRVRVTFGLAGVTATCTCPFDWGGWCKHIAAALLAYLAAPDKVEALEPIEERLAALDDAKRAALLLDLARVPDLVERIERALDAAELRWSVGRAVEPSTRRSAVDTAAFRKRVRAELATPDEYYEWGHEEELPTLDALFDTIRPFVAAGDTLNALALLEALTDELARGVSSGRIDPEMIDAEWPALDALWVEPLLDPSLPPEERAVWADKLLGWDGDLDEHGYGGSLPAAQLAAEQGWEGPIPSAWRRGERVALPAPPDSYDEEGEEDEDDQDFPSYDEDKDALAIVATALLAMLARQGDDEAYLRAARATEQGEAYLLKLVAMGRGAEAAAEAPAMLRTGAEALAVAQALHAAGDVAAALRIGEHGMALGSRNEAASGWAPAWQPRLNTRSLLTSWLSGAAEAAGEQQLALRAAVSSFEALPSVPGYERAQRLAGEAWEGETRPALLGHLRKTIGRDSGEVSSELFVREGLFDEAMRVADHSRYDPVINRVMAAVRRSHPDWVVARARQLAEPIIEQGRAAHYDEAVHWMSQIRDAYLETDRVEEWQAYRARVEAEHGRKYKLMGLMKGL